MNVTGIENIDVTDIVHGHQDYVYKIGDILHRVRHGQPFEASAPSFIASEYNANEVLQEVVKLDIVAETDSEKKERK
jgi:methyl coenzyme M reductase subunit C-like uncharacterized protein (methanogenesis marker protein 7)